MAAQFNSSPHHRHSIRLKGYDYSQPGAYFVTMVTQGRACLFGEIRGGEMKLNDAGTMIVKWWQELPNKFPAVELGASIVMPNHFHGIIQIAGTVGADLRVCPDGSDKGGHIGPPQPIPPQPIPPQLVSPQPVTSPPVPPQQPDAALSQMIQWFKTMTTNEYIRGVKELNWKPFAGKLWQRNYYEHIIRDEKEMARIWNYIEANPSHWKLDRENQFKK